MAANITTMQSEVTFLDLIDKNNILIPVIQRDYAQGRTDEKTTKIREGFISSIMDKLLSDNNDQSLLLDFIYGSTNENLTFTPLDGQQRLTTLFLLHWYLVPTENLKMLSKTKNDIISSMFSYETRISSKDFCDALVKIPLSSIKKQQFNTQNSDDFESSDDNLNVEESTKKKISLSEIIRNQSWFMWGWRNDPTVKGMLVMLDELDYRLGDLDEKNLTDIWEKLEKGAIIFHLLPLEQFALTDELYVKMNARGKELSAFDFFKSTLEEEMHRNKVSYKTQNRWKENIDSNWIDLFWNKLAKPYVSEEICSAEDQKMHVDSVEEGYLIFLKRLIILYFIENIDNYKIDLEDSSIIRLLPFTNFDKSNITKKLLEQAIQDIDSLFPLFLKTSFFNDNLFEYIIELFESLIYLDLENLKHDGSLIISKVAFEKGTSSLFLKFIESTIDYEGYLLFYAMIQFFKYNSSSKIFDNPALTEELNLWMRIIRNLSTLNNTWIDSSDDFIVTLNTYKNWAFETYGESGTNSITKYFANHPRKNEPKGRFVNDQFEEEIIKADLIENSGNKQLWKKEILEIEEHKYLLGQIRFLLQWSKVETGYDIEIFEKYKLAIEELFANDGLEDELCQIDNHLFRNLMMTIDENYLLIGEKCFVNNKGKNRDRSWKSYLRNTSKALNIKTSLDKYKLKNSSSLKEFCISEIEIAEASVQDWRRCFLGKPIIYNKCEKNQIEYWDKSKREICLLETSITWTGNNRHSELNTYYWYLKFSNFKDWSSNYFNSQTETPLMAKFSKEELKIEISFQRVENILYYIINLNFNPNDSTYLESIKGWRRTFDTSEFIDVEYSLIKLMQ